MNAAHTANTKYTLRIEGQKPIEFSEIHHVREAFLCACEAYPAMAVTASMTNPDGYECNIDWRLVELFDVTVDGVAPLLHDKTPSFEKIMERWLKLAYDPAVKGTLQLMLGRRVLREVVKA